MGFKKLQLNLLSQSGELINCVSCFAGQVSVFRAPTYAALEVYQRALAGIPGPERISIFLDDRSFIPTEHLFIGFGEHREGAHEPVIQSFIRLGISTEAIQSLCASYDLSIDSRTTWHQLTKCEARRIRLLLATRTKQQILVLNDPFEPLANHWKERFAELISTYARTNKEIVIVTSLSYRPESWIDNPSIARIQVGEEIQRTIGFGAQGGKGNDLVAQIRELIKDEAKVAQILASPSVAAAIPNTAMAAPKDESEEFEDDDYENEERRPVETRPLFGAMLGGLAARFQQADREASAFSSLKGALLNPISSSLIAGSLIFAGTYFLFLRNAEEAPSPEAPVVIAEAPPQQNNVDVPVEAEPPTDTAKLVEAPPPEPVKMARLVLDEYPPSVKESVMLSFQGLGRSASTGAGNTDTTPENPPLPQTAKSEEAGDLLKLLASASDSGEGLPDSQPYSNSDDDAPTSNVAPSFNSEEEKREAIRKRFLEAIERAQNMRRQQAEGE